MLPPSASRTMAEADGYRNNDKDPVNEIPTATRRLVVAYVIVDNMAADV